MQLRESIFHNFSQNLPPLPFSNLLYAPENAHYKYTLIPNPRVFLGWCDYARVNNKHARARSQIPLSDMCYMCDYVQIRRTRKDYYNFKL